MKSVFTKSLFTRRGGYPSKRVPQHTHTLRCVYKAARVTQVGGLPYLPNRVTLAGLSAFSLVDTPDRETPTTQVNFLYS